MNKDKIKGTWKVTKGRVKEEVGHATGNASTETEGIVDQLKGRIQKGIGNVKDSLKKGVDMVIGG